MIQRAGLLLVTTLAFSACGSGKSEAKSDFSDDVRAGEKKTESVDAPSNLPSAPEDLQVVVGDDEIVPVLNPILPTPADDRRLPEDPAAFRREVMKTLKTDSSEEVLSMVDVVLLLNPADQEMREIRANILLKQGLTEDAAVDFDRCCKGGRPSCCR